MIGSPTESGRLRIVHTESSRGWGGQELRILSESAGLIARGHSVRIACPPDAPIGRAAVDRGIPVETVPMCGRNLPSLRNVRRWLAGITRANETGTETGADIINTHSNTDGWLVALAARSLRSAPPVVRTRHVDFSVTRTPWNRWVYAHGACRIVTCGEGIRQKLRDDLRLPAEHVISVPTGVDTDRFVPGDRQAARRQLGLPADRILIGMVAMLRGTKGHRVLLEALHRLGRPDTLAVFIGDGPQREPLQLQTRELGLTGQVLMPGYCDDVVPWLQSFDLLAFPSLSGDGVPQGVSQAVSCGLPVVASRAGSIDEAVRHQESGLLIPPGDPAALADALRRLIDDAGLRSRFGDAGRRLALARLGTGRMLDDMEAVFLDAARRGGTARITTAEPVRRAA